MFQKSDGAQYARTSLVNLSVEEENLAAIPFAVLERRVGKRIGKLEIQGTKVLPDGSQARVTWQVQGNNELGLPTEQDLDIFIALGVLTFQNNFQKTVSFSGREIAKILNISSVHGKFYQRLKLAMDRFIPLRFRAISETDRQEEVKWLNVFQEASFSLDRATGRCTGTVTWTDKLIRSMDYGFFRMLDANRYMALDGITAKHLYRFLALAFEKTEILVINAAKLATEHLGILTPPKYLSRLMQTLEPAFDQLISIHVLGSYHVVSSEDWTIALRRHASYVPESKNLLSQVASGAPELTRTHVERALEKAGLPAKVSAQLSAMAHNRKDFYFLLRAANVLEAMKEQEVLPHVAASMIRRVFDAGMTTNDANAALDRCEIAVEVCRHKKASGQVLRNSGGFLTKIIKDDAAWRRAVPEDLEQHLRARFEQRDASALRQEEEAEQRGFIMEYERFRYELASALFQEMTEDRKRVLRREQYELLKQQERFERMPAEARDAETDAAIIQELAKREAPPFEKWFMRRKAEQAVLPFGPPHASSEVA
jgi:hypothetical protein